MKNEIINVDSVVTDLINKMDPVCLKIWGFVGLIVGTSKLVEVTAAANYEVNITKGDFSFSLKKPHNEIIDTDE